MQRTLLYAQSSFSLLSVVDKILALEITCLGSIGCRLRFLYFSVALLKSIMAL